MNPFVKSLAWYFMDNMDSRQEFSFAMFYEIVFDCFQGKLLLTQWM